MWVYTRSLQVPVLGSSWRTKSCCKRGQVTLGLLPKSAKYFDNDPKMHRNMELLLQRGKNSRALFIPPPTLPGLKGDGGLRVHAHIHTRMCASREHMVSNKNSIKSLRKQMKLWQQTKCQLFPLNYLDSIKLQDGLRLTFSSKPSLYCVNS